MLCQWMDLIVQFDHKYDFLLLPRPNKYPQTAAVSEVSISLRKPTLASGEIESECQGVPRAVKSDSGCKVVVDTDMVQSLDRHVLNIGEAVRSGPSRPFSRVERG